MSSTQQGLVAAQLLTISIFLFMIWIVIAIAVADCSVSSMKVMMTRDD